MNLIKEVNLRSIAVPTALVFVMLLARIGNTQVIGLSLPISGSSDQEAAGGHESVLGFSSIAANDFNTDCNLETLESVIDAHVISDPSHIELAAHSDISEFDAVWWPRFDISDAPAADVMTTALAARVSVPALVRSVGGMLNGSTLFETWNAGPESPTLPVIAQVDRDFASAAQPGDVLRWAGNVDGLPSGGFAVRGFLGQSPLSAPEPGSIPLFAALCSLSAMLAVRCSRK